MSKGNSGQAFWAEIERRATCGHADDFGYFAGTVCGRCAKRNHRRATRGARR